PNLESAPGGWRGAAWSVKSWTMLRAFDAYLSVGTRARDYLMAFGVDHRRVFTAPHAIDNEFFARAAVQHRQPDARRAVRERLGLASDAFVVMFVGKLDENKRPLDFVRATAKVPGAAALIVGAGPLEEAVRAEAARLGITASFPGFVNQTELGAMYGAADCLALPSNHETWGLV